jgi:hypothetical protein
MDSLLLSMIEEASKPNKKTTTVVPINNNHPR